MPAFILYGALGSTNTDRVRLTLAEGGVTDYELVMLDLRKGEHKSSENLKRHPFGKVPSITLPDGFTLFESRVICKYLARKYSIPLLPAATDFEATARFEQAEGVEMSYFAEPAGRLSFEKFAKGFLGLPPNEGVIAEMEKSTNGFFDYAEQLLQKQEYMAGEEFSLADIYYIPLIRRLFVCGYEDVVSSRNAVSAWWTRCMARPAIEKLIAADSAAMAAARK